MVELEFRTIRKYLDGLKREPQDEIVYLIWDMGRIVARAKLKEKRQCDISIVQQRQFTGVQNRRNSIGIENKQKTQANSGQA